MVDCSAFKNNQPSCTKSSVLKARIKITTRLARFVGLLFHSFQRESIRALMRIDFTLVRRVFLRGFAGSGCI